MYININGTRIKLSTIRQYKASKQTIDKQKPYLELKLVGSTQIFYFNNNHELNLILDSLDKHLKVIN